MSNFKTVEKNLNKLQTKGKSLFLAQDQGLEHGAYELVGNTASSEYMFEVAEKSKVDAYICHKGQAEKSGHSFKTNMMIKVNGKCNLGPKDDPYSPVLCSVRTAVDLGAKAIGFTNFVGSKHQAKIFEDFRKIQEEAHDFGLPVTSWMYPRGASIKNDLSKDVLMDSARVGFELGADGLKMRYNGNRDDLKEIVRVADKAKVFVAGGPKTNSSKEFLQMVEEINDTGISGMATGRNIWQHDNPVGMVQAIRDIQQGENVYKALKRLEK